MKPTQHAIRRADERFKLGKDDLQRIGQQVEASRAQFICAETLDRSLYRLVYDRHQVHVVYDKRAHKIITVMGARLYSGYVEILRRQERHITTKPEVPFEVPPEWVES